MKWHFPDSVKMKEKNDAQQSAKRQVELCALPAFAQTVPAESSLRSAPQERARKTYYQLYEEKFF